MNHLAGAIDAAVFDCDGTLIDSESIWLEMIADLLRSYEISSHCLAVHDFRGVTADCAAGLLARELSANAAQVRHRIDDTYSGLLQKIDAPIPEAAAFLESISGHLPIAVATNGRREDVEMMLKSTGLWQFVDHLIAIEDVAHGKPEPDPYLLACTKLGSAPGNTLAFEDSPVGARAAQQAGCVVVGVHDRATETFPADVHVPSFNALKFETETRTLIAQTH